MQRLLITDRHGQDHTGESRGLGAQFVLTIWRFFLFSASFYHISTFFFLSSSSSSRYKKEERDRENAQHPSWRVSCQSLSCAARTTNIAHLCRTTRSALCYFPRLDLFCFIFFFSFFPIPPATHLLAFAVGTDRPTKLLRYAAALLPSSFIYLYLYRNIK